MRAGWITFFICLDSRVCNFLPYAFYYITASGFLFNRVFIVSLDTPIGLGGGI
jgi:hypothetical protein